MRVDVLALQRFYASPLGDAARRARRAGSRRCGRSVDGSTCSASAIRSPYLDRFRATARRVVP
jgi:hypothetical protein